MMSFNRKNLIIVSTFFPPNRHIAVSRVEAYAKYLADDHDITVIALGQEDKSVNYKFENGAICKVHYVTNKGALTSFLFYTGKESKVMHKFKTLLRVIYNKLDISHFKVWAAKAARVLESELKNNQVDVLISSYAPEDVLEISYQALTKLNNNHTKWVLDMRDEYSDELGFPNWIKNKRQKNELKYSKRADLVVSVSEPLVDIFKKRMPEAKDYMELRNGFDHSSMPKEYKKEEILKIGYFGSLHGEAKPDLFFLAVQELGLTDKVKIFFAVRNVTFNTPYNLKESIIFLPFMSYAESIKTMSKMDANLLILPSKTRLGVFSGKVFDYLSVRRPILALVNPNDVAAKLITDTNSGYIADFNSLEETKKMVMKLYEDWQSCQLKQPSVEDIARQHRKYQVQKLNEWIAKQ